MITIPDTCPYCGATNFDFEMVDEYFDDTYLTDVYKCTCSCGKDFFMDRRINLVGVRMYDFEDKVLFHMEDHSSGTATVGNDGVSWDYYDIFHRSNAVYLPDHGEGETMATQVCTAINKLIYKWYNDGDTYDTAHAMKGWANDLSSYANWLAKNVDGAQEILDRIFQISYIAPSAEQEAQYEYILKDLADRYLKWEYLNDHRDIPKEGSIYECDGPYKYAQYNEHDEYEDDEYDEEDADEEDD